MSRIGRSYRAKVFTQQPLVAQTASAVIAQVAAVLTITGGTQQAAAIQLASVAQVAANLTITGGLQIISISTSPLPPQVVAKVILLTDGRMALRLGGIAYLPL